MVGSNGPRSKESIDKANIQLDNFIKILQSQNIKVDRPTPIDFTKAIETPDWQNDGQFGSMPPRDVILTVGNEMLEAPMSIVVVGLNILLTDLYLKNIMMKILICDGSQHQNLV